MLKNIEVLFHASIRFSKNKIIYFDPFNINKEYKDADMIMITHSHYDHFSEEDINKVKKENTKIVITSDLYDRTKKLGFEDDNILIVKPNESYNFNNLIFKTIPAYNTNKKFHPKENNWVGYILEIENNTYYIAGDTDITDENQKIKCDVAFVPIGGTYTMTVEEAAKLINKIEPKIVVPIHYGVVVGNKNDAKEFKKEIKSEIKCEILIK